MRCRGVIHVVAAVSLATFWSAHRVLAQAPLGSGFSGPAALRLDLMRARDELAHAASELARADALYQRALLAPAEYEDRRASFARARLTYVGALAAAANASERVSVVRAVKRRGRDGRLHVRVTLRNESASLPPGIDTLGAAVLGDELRAARDWSTVRGMAVALKSETGANGTTIARPYQQSVPSLASGESRSLDFELLDDATDIVVETELATRSAERRVRLEDDDAAGAIAIDAAQFSLEGDLGAQVVYDLRLRRAHSSNAATRIVVRGLPPDITSELRDGDGRTRLGQVRFADGATMVRVQLALSLPARPTAAVKTDAPIAFDVDAVDSTSNRDASRDAASPIGHARLELVPRGVARIELRPATLALQASDDAPALLALDVRNAGTGAIDGVKLRAEAPSRWTAALVPGTIASLAPGEERRVRVELRPPSDAIDGDYELRLGVDDAGTASHVDVEDKMVRVRYATSASLAWPVVGIIAVGASMIGAGALLRRWLSR